MRAPSARPDLEVHEDLPFQRRDWVAQRVGWAALALLLTAAMFGALGSGPLSHATGTDGAALTVNYERFVRHGAPTEWLLRVEPRSRTTAEAHISVSRAYLSAHELLRIVPTPARASGRGETIEFTFEVRPHEALHARWSFEPDEIGRHVAVVRLDDGPAVRVEQFTYP
jgi:hypothetical protein